MVDENRLQQYKSWFGNLSFFSDNTFILDQIDNLWKLVNFIDNVYINFCKYDVSKEDFSSVSKQEIIDLAQYFFDTHNIAINITTLINENILILDNGSGKLSDEFFHIIKTGKSYYEDGKRKIKVILKNNLLDALVLVHEIVHYLNQPEDKRSFSNDLLTESLSYGVELIFAFDLLNNKYKQDGILYFKEFEKGMFSHNYYIYYIYKIIYLYKMKGDINKEKYNELFNDDEYEETLDYFEKYSQEKRSIVNDTWGTIGHPLAIYILEEYKKDNNFMNNLKEFNNRLKNNNDDIFYSLQTIGIKNIDDVKRKIEASAFDYIEFLKGLYDGYENKR